MRKLFNFLRSLFAALGVLSGLVTILWALFATTLNELAKDNSWHMLLGLVALSFSYAAFVNRPKSTIKLKLSHKVEAVVKFGDLFNEKEIIVIPVNDYFDTEVDDEIVSSKTLHGIFINKFFSNNKAELHEQIAKGLSKYKAIETCEKRNSESKDRYPLGTICEVKLEDKIFYLVALTRFNSNHRAEVTNSEYQRVLCDLFTYIEQRSQGRKVNVPLIGGGHSGVDLSKQKLLEFLLFSIVLKDDLTLINGVNIILHDSVKKDIDLASTDVLFKTIGK